MVVTNQANNRPKHYKTKKMTIYPFIICLIIYLSISIYLTKKIINLGSNFKDQQIDEQIQMTKWIYRWINRWIKRWINRWINMYKWVDEFVYKYFERQIIRELKRKRYLRCYKIN